MMIYTTIISTNVQFSRSRRVEGLPEGRISLYFKVFRDFKRERNEALKILYINKNIKVL
jgi:hypothetical protein